MKIILINPPGYLPTSMPYSLAGLYGVLNSKLEEEIIAIDLNAKLHKYKFNSFYQKLNENEDYFQLLEKFYKVSKEYFKIISKQLLEKKELEELNYLKKIIEKEKPKILAISLTYNSQIFYTKALINSLKGKNIKIVLGGPADYSKILKQKEVTSLANAEQLINYCVNHGAKQKNEKIKPDSPNDKSNPIPDFSIFKTDDYFTKQIVYPIRTSIACPYKQCTFCTHHGNENFKLFDLSTLKETILKNNIKKLCFIDDDIPPIRIKQISKILSGLNVKWWCQLRPTKQVQSVLEEASEAGLTSVAWGLESGNQRVLDLMQKGTNIQDIKDTLNLAKKFGIHNMTYTMFGFPSETESEFMDTINFLEDNSKNIDIISPSVFGLQHGSKIIKEAKIFGIASVEFEKRTYLSDKISYSVNVGLSQKQATKLFKEHKHQLQQINKIPNIISVFKEQILNYKVSNIPKLK